MKRAVNSAKIHVTYPDGCRADWETRPDGRRSQTAAALGQWLIEVGETIIEGATTAGQHAPPDADKG